MLDCCLSVSVSLYEFFTDKQTWNDWAWQRQNLSCALGKQRVLWLRRWWWRWRRHSLGGRFASTTALHFHGSQGEKCWKKMRNIQWAQTACWHWDALRCSPNINPFPIKARKHMGQDSTQLCGWLQNWLWSPTIPIHNTMCQRLIII